LTADLASRVRVLAQKSVLQIKQIRQKTCAPKPTNSLLRERPGSIRKLRGWQSNQQMKHSIRHIALNRYHTSFKSRDLGNM
jgi:hypothetical protein